MRVKNHPFLPDGRYLVYRVVAAEMIGRKLRPDEHVHHIDGRACNNKPGNLEVLSASEHAIRTHLGRPESKLTRTNISKAQRGRRITEEWRENIKKGCRGKTPRRKAIIDHRSEMAKFTEARPEWLSITKPWVKLKIARRTWFRIRQKLFIEWKITDTMLLHPSTGSRRTARSPSRSSRLRPSR